MNALKIYFFAVFSIFFDLFLSEYLFAQHKIEDYKILYNLTGTWEMHSKKGVLYEIWNIKNDSLLEGISYRINNKDTIPQETVQLCFSEGIISYIPSVPKQNLGKAVVFRLREIEGKRFIFENITHDFPQSIIYDITYKDKLLVLINGTTSKGFKEIPFNFKKK